MKRIVCFFLFAGGFCYAGAQSIPKWKINDVVNYFTKQNDTVYVVNLWSTCCKPCVKEIPYLQAVAKKYAGQKVKLLLVSLDSYKLYPTQLKAFAKSKKFTASMVWLDETDADIFCPAIDAKWGGSIPATIIVNGKTSYKQFYEQEFTAKEFELELKKALSSKTVYSVPKPIDHSIESTEPE